MACLRDTSYKNGPLALYPFTSGITRISERIYTVASLVAGVVGYSGVAKEREI